MNILIRNMDSYDLKQVVQIHIKAFQGFFLTHLGARFLFKLYKHFLIDSYSICKVAEVDNMIEGFAVGNLEPDLFILRMLIPLGFILVYYSIRSYHKRPFFLMKKLITALFSGGDYPKGHLYAAQLSSIGVDPSVASKGIGTYLINAFCKAVYQRGYGQVYLTTDKIGNDSVNQFYMKNGFMLYDTIEKTGGRRMNRYIRELDEKSFGLNNVFA